MDDGLSLRGELGPTFSQLSAAIEVIALLPDGISVRCRHGLRAGFRRDRRASCKCRYIVRPKATKTRNTRMARAGGSSPRPHFNFQPHLAIRLNHHPVFGHVTVRRDAFHTVWCGLSYEHLLTSPLLVHSTSHGPRPGTLRCISSGTTPSLSIKSPKLAILHQ